MSGDAPKRLGRTQARPRAAREGRRRGGHAGVGGTRARAGGALDDALADPDVRTSYRTAALAGQYRESLVALLERLPTSRDDGWDAAFERLAQRLGDG